MSLKQFLSMEDHQDVVDNTSLSSAPDVPTQDGAEVHVIQPAEGLPEFAEADLMAAEASLERYIGFIDMHEATGINAHTAQAIALGLKRHSKVLAKHMPVQISTESYEGTLANRRASKETREMLVQARNSILASRT